MLEVPDPLPSSPIVLYYPIDRQETSQKGIPDIPHDSLLRTNVNIARSELPISPPFTIHRWGVDDELFTAFLIEEGVGGTPYTEFIDRLQSEVQQLLTKQDLR